MSSNVIARQQPSTMPVSRYRAYADQFAVELPDRQWPSRQIVQRRAGARSTCATATRP